MTNVKFCSSGTNERKIYACIFCAASKSGSELVINGVLLYSKLLDSGGKWRSIFAWLNQQANWISFISKFLDLLGIYFCSIRTNQKAEIKAFYLRTSTEK